MAASTPTPAATTDLKAPEAIHGSSSLSRPEKASDRQPPTADRRPPTADQDSFCEPITYNSRRAHKDQADRQALLELLKLLQTKLSVDKPLRGRRSDVSKAVAA